MIFREKYFCMENVGDEFVVSRFSQIDSRSVGNEVAPYIESGFNITNEENAVS